LDSGKSVIAVKNMPGEDISRYGVVGMKDQIGDNVFSVSSIVEKPRKGSEPSSYVSLGRYLFTSEIFDALRALAEQKRDGEFYQTDVINLLAQQGKVVALDFEGQRYDTGEPLGYLKTIVDYALQDARLKDEFTEHLRNKLNIQGTQFKAISQ